MVMCSGFPVKANKVLFYSQMTAGVLVALCEFGLEAVTCVVNLSLLQTVETVKWFVSPRSMSGQESFSFYF